MPAKGTRSSGRRSKKSEPAAAGPAPVAEHVEKVKEPPPPPPVVLDMDNPVPGDPVEDDDKPPTVEQEEEIFLTAVTPNEIRDESCKTFIFKNEGHTLGNSLRFVISHYPEVKFCGHTIPHPSEDEMHLRIQTLPGSSAVDVLRKGLQDLVDVCDHTEAVFDAALGKFAKESNSEHLFQVPGPPRPRRRH